MLPHPEPQTTELPSFRYHPDPVATGSFVRSKRLCLSCVQARGWVYTGPVYAVGDYRNDFCPWCIADGSAAATFGAEFTDEYDVPNGVPKSVIKELGRRTPGYAAWRQERWLYHCDDACAFLGGVGRRELERMPPEAAAALAAFLRSGDMDEAAIPAFLAALDREGPATGYVFRCLQCSTHLGYCDQL
ncbi:MAG: CbrC family protein [Actinomycetota bacterium]